MKEDLTFDTIPTKFCAMVEEYRLELAKKSGVDLQLDVSLPGYTICGIHETVLISRKFGFIQWLVQNDKIDNENIKKIEIPVDTKLRALVAKDEKTCFNRLYTLKLLMLLSISDTPIEDLISYLK